MIQSRCQGEQRAVDRAGQSRTLPRADSLSPLTLSHQGSQAGSLLARLACHQPTHHSSDRLVTCSFGCRPQKCPGKGKNAAGALRGIGGFS